MPRGRSRSASPLPLDGGRDLSPALRSRQPSLDSLDSHASAAAPGQRKEKKDKKDKKEKKDKEEKKERREDREGQSRPQESMGGLDRGSITPGPPLRLEGREPMLSVGPGLTGM